MKMAVLGATITTVSLISKKEKNAKVGFFLLKSYIRNTVKIMKIKKITSWAEQSHTRDFL
jgi:hypothetical protein